MRLAQACGLVGLLARWVRIGTSVGTNPAGKVVISPAPLAHRAHGIDLHLPTHWPWATRWQRLFQATHRPLPTPT
ncbi:MAG: hypothetical protein ACT4NP_20280 [Pseudonocardiales bacterium]